MPASWLRIHLTFPGDPVARVVRVREVDVRRALWETRWRHGKAWLLKGDPIMVELEFAPEGATRVLWLTEKQMRDARP